MRVATIRLFTMSDENKNGHLTPPAVHAPDSSVDQRSDEVKPAAVALIINIRMETTRSIYSL